MLDLIVRVSLLPKNLYLLNSPASNFPLLSSAPTNFTFLSRQSAVKQVSFRKLYSFILNDKLTWKTKYLLNRCVCTKIYDSWF